MGSSESVGAGQHPHLVAQQAAVGQIVNVGLDHSGVDAHPPTLPPPGLDLQDFMRAPRMLVSIFLNLLLR
jgi:hypothetical protein